jgi:hypothetical protein
VSTTFSTPSESGDDWSKPQTQSITLTPSSNPDVSGASCSSRFGHEKDNPPFSLRSRCPCTTRSRRVHPHHSSSPRGGFASSSMPSLTGLAESIHKELRTVPPTAAAVASSDAIASSTLSKLPVLDRTSASPQKGGSSARPRRRRRSESVASNRSGVSIRARGKRIKA